MKKISLNGNLKLSKTILSNIETLNVKGGIVHTDARSGEYNPCKGFSRDGIKENGCQFVTFGVQECRCAIDMDTFNNFVGANPEFVVDFAPTNLDTAAFMHLVDNGVVQIIG